MKHLAIGFVLGLLFPLPIGWFMLGLLGSLWDTAVQTRCRRDPARVFAVAWLVVFLFSGRRTW